MVFDARKAHGNPVNRGVQYDEDGRKKHIIPGTFFSRHHLRSHQRRDACALRNRAMGLRQQIKKRLQINSLVQSV